MYLKYITQNTELANENTIFLVAETDGVLLGSLIAHIDYRPSVFSPQKRVFVDHVVVDEKHRGKGISRSYRIVYIQAISKKGFWFQIAAEAKFKPEAYSSIPRI
jgi:predicted GNAT family acetyltransferase